MKHLIVFLFLVLSKNVLSQQLPGLLSSSAFNDTTITITSFNAMYDTLFINVRERVADTSSYNGYRWQYYIYNSKDDGEKWIQKCNDAPRIFKIYGDNIFGLKEGCSPGSISSCYPYTYIMYSFLHGTDWSTYNTANTDDRGSIDFIDFLGDPFELVVAVVSAWASSGAYVNVNFCNQESKTTFFNLRGIGSDYIPAEKKLNEIVNIGNMIFGKSDYNLFRIKYDSMTLLGALDLTDVLNDLIVWDSTLFVATRSGLFRSDDSGETFARVDDESSPKDFGKLHLKNGVFLMVNSTGVWRSDDTGKTWQKSLMAGPVRFAVGATKLFTMTKNFVVHTSIDTGKTWSPEYVGIRKSYNTKMPKNKISNEFPVKVTSERICYTLLSSATVAIEIYTLQGKLMYCSKELLVPAGRYSETVKKIPVGVYAVRCAINGMTMFQKIRIDR